MAGTYYVEDNTYYEEHEDEYYRIAGLISWLVSEIEGGVGYSDAEIEEMQSDLAAAQCCLRAF